MVLKSETFWSLVDRFMKVIETETGFPVLIYDAKGYIIRATDRSRVGDLHAGAEKIMHHQANEYAVTVAEAAQNPLVREGYSCPIIVDGQILAGFGITGKLELAKPLAKTAVRMIDAWIENVQYQDQLVASEQKYRNLFENASNGIFQATLDGQFLTANPALAHILGYDTSSALLAEVTDIANQLYVRPEERNQFLETLRTSGRITGFMTQLKRRDGRIIDISMDAHLMHDPETGASFLEGHLLDITERRKAEEAIRLSEEKYSKAFNNSPVWVVLSSLESGRYIEVNETFLNNMEYTRPEIVGRTSLDLETWVEPQDRQKVLLLLETGGVVRNHEIKRRTKTGKILTMLFSADTIEISGEQCMLSVSLDITERKKMEEMVVQSEKMLSVGGLAAGMAHEINNPLAGMIQTAGVMANRLTDPALPANRQAAEAAGTTIEAITAFMEARGILHMLDNLRQSGGRAAEIVANMLSFARKGESAFSSHDLARLLDQTMDLAGSDYNLKKKYDFRRIKIMREYDSDMPLVPCEAAKLQQVLLNLLRNGAEAMQQKAEGRRQQPDKDAYHPCFTLRLAHEKEAGMVRIEVADNGPGMDAAIRKRVFEPFFTTKPTDQGTGLGLSVSYFIVTEKHGGEMQVESTPDKGSTFIIRLPVGNGNR